ncbi:hypothetical protein EAI_16809 [Harpegnathos saltator]|uniref:Uncharacterized protein n=1 Tax=Harpegnathos saltator TaxID=610380 RepID=E2B6D9_HARSA|nr:hypothetical protein EAI_16809 [Harpegnathos saltator]
MSQFLKIVCDCIIAASVANPIIKRGKYLCELASDNDEKTYEVFYKFAAMCSSGLLAMLFACCMGSQSRLWKREDYSENEKDIGDRNKPNKCLACNINENGIDIIHDDAVHVAGNIIEYDDNGVDETTQDASEAGETQDFRISQATLVEVQQGSGYEQSKKHQRDKS